LSAALSSTEPTFTVLLSAEMVNGEPINFEYPTAVALIKYFPSAIFSISKSPDLFDTATLASELSFAFNKEMVTPSKTPFADFTEPVTFPILACA
jgi:hypothetical protein